MDRFSFDAPSKTQTLLRDGKKTVLLQEIKTLRMEDGRSISLRDVRSLTFVPEKRAAAFKERPTGQVEVVVRLNFPQLDEPRFAFVMSPEGAKVLYQKLFDEFFADACLTEVRKAISVRAFPLVWSRELEDWQPFQVEREVKETVEKNW